MLEYIDELGQIYSENDINKLAKEQKLSFNDIVKSKKLSVKKPKEFEQAKAKQASYKDLLSQVGTKQEAPVTAPKTGLGSESVMWKAENAKVAAKKQVKKEESSLNKIKEPSTGNVKPVSTLIDISEYQKQKDKEEEESFSNYLIESFDRAVSDVVQSVYKAPEFLYEAAATITNPIANLVGDVIGVETKDATSEGIMKTFGITNVPANILKKRMQESDKIIQDYSLKNGVDPLTAIENGNYLGAAKLVAGGTVQATPMMAAAMLSGGSSTALAGIAASTAVSRSEQLKEEQPEMESGERIKNSIVSGLLEGYLGNLFTGASGAVVKKIIADKGAKVGSKIISNGLRSTLETAIEKNPLIGIVGEVAEESSVELGNQLNDINSGIRTELDNRAIINAGIIATGMSGTNTVPVYAAKGYMAAKDYSQVKQVNKEINNLSAQLASPYINDSDKTIIASRVSRLVNENKRVVGESLQKITSLPNSVKTEINTINTDLDDIRSKYFEISDNNNIPVDVKGAMINELELNVKDLQNRKTRIIQGNYIYDDFNKLPEEEKNRITALATETLTADAELSGITKAPKPEDINKEALNIYNTERIATDLTTDITRTAKAIETLGLKSNVELPELKTSNDVITYLKENTELDDDSIEDYSGSLGLFVPLKDGKEALIINQEEAAMESVVTTGQHEFLHKLIYKAVKDNPELQKKIGTQLYNHIEGYIGEETFANTEFKNRYQDYKVDFENTKNTIDSKITKANDYLSKGLITQDKYNETLRQADTAIANAEGKYLEETLPLLSEALSKGDIKYEETFFTKIGDILRKVFQKFGLSKVNFETGKDVFNFVRDYNKSFEKGEFTKAFKTLAEKGEYKGKIAVAKPSRITKEVKESKPLTKVDELKQDLKDLEDEYDEGYGDLPEEEYLSKKANIEGKIKIAVRKEAEAPKEIEKPKEVVTEEDEVKEIIKNEKGAISSDRVQQIYNTKGKDGAAEIIKLFKPITNRIVDKRRDVPGFDKELLTDEIETGVGGILDLITKYNPESGVPLAAYINKYLPVRAIATSKRILEGEFKKDVTEEKGLVAEETVQEVKEKPKYKNALESNLFEAEEFKTIENKIITILRTLKSRIDTPITLNRTVTPLINEIRDEVGKQIDIDLKTIMGGKKDDQLKKFMVKYKRYVLENMTTTWLMGKDGQGGIPQAIQKQIDGRWVNYPNWVGQKIDREKTTTDQAGRTSGAELVRRLPNAFNNVSTEDYLAQVIGPDGNPIRGRKESLAKAIAEESAFDIISNDFANEGLLYEAFSTNQQRLGLAVTETLAVEIDRQIERGNIKMSKKALKDSLNNLKDNEWDINNKDFIDFVNNLNKKDSDYVKELIGYKTIKSLISQLKAINYENAGYEFEEKALVDINNAVKSVYPDFGEFKILTKAAAKSNSRAVDLQIEKDNTVYNIELKASKDAQIGSITIQNINGDPIINKDLGINNKIISALKNNNGVKGYFDFLLSDAIGGKLNKNGNIKVKLNGFTEAQAKGLQANATTTVTANEELVNRLNNNKNDAIIFKDSGSFSYGNTKLDASLPILKGDVNFNIRVVRGSRDKNGYVTLYFRGFPSMAKTWNQVSAINIDENASDLLKAIAVASFAKESKKITNSQNSVIDASTNFLKESKGISVFDFDDTIGLTKGSVLYTMPDATSGKLNAEEFAKEGANLLEEGAVFDFSEFSKVVGGKPGPMVEKMKKMIGKFGPNNFFILTARPANSAEPIHQFLASININIPLENITGLGNSTGQAKADWMVAKAAEGYNDFYFADDAIANVNAVKNALDVLDVKSKIQQAKIKFSKTISPRFNQIIEENTGMENYKVFSDIVARRRGAGKNKFNIYVPPSAADFELLLYNFVGKGTLGEEQKRFFDQALLIPYVNGNDLMDAARQSIKREYKALTKSFPDIKIKLEKLTPDKDFTYDQALRVAIWKEAGTEIPGLSQRDTNKLTELVNNDPELSAFKEGLKAMSRQEKGWVTPSEFWDTDTIISDLHNVTEGTGRKKFLGEFMDNVEEMFGKWEAGRLVGPNMNKIEAVYGSNVREALEDSLYRMINGKNKSYGKDKETSRWSEWVNGSTGAIMFLNARSAALQLIGAVNFLNLRDNNPVEAGAAFANQKQYWSDFALIWNSDKMKERRGGLKEDVASAEIANAAAGSKNKVGAVMSYLLKIGYTPTQLADSFAIASGGAPFYRNRIKTYLKEGDTQQEAEDKAWKDFTKVSDETQQSGDPKDISKQQASPAGRLLLTFQNTAMQQSRIIKKSYLDLKNGRGDAKTHIAKIGYYLLIQNIMFSALQQGLFAVLFGIDEEETEEEIKKRLADKDKRIIDVANGVLDSILRGTGFAGGVVATVKNIAMKYMEEREKEFKADYAKVVLEAANISPPIGSKLRKLYSAAQQTKFDKDLIEARGWSVMQDGRVHLGPMYSVTGKVSEAVTNVPLDRLVNKIENVSQAMNAQNKAWQRVAVGVGFTPYTIGIEETPGDVLIREKAKEIRKEEGIIKGKETRKATKDSIRSLPMSERVRMKKEASRKRRDERMKRNKRKMGE
jgi:hypothetical protein